jgi:hypothetical protein
VFGQPVTLAVTVNSVSSTPTGPVEFFDGAQSLGSVALVDGVANLQVTTLAVGLHSVSAAYGGDGSFLPSASASLAFAVSRATTATTLTATPNPVRRRQPVILSATVVASAPGSGTPTGQVTFKEGNKTLGVRVSGILCVRHSMRRRYDSQTETPYP